MHGLYTQSLFIISIWIYVYVILSWKIRLTSRISRLLFLMSLDNDLPKPPSATFWEKIIHKETSEAFLLFLRHGQKLPRFASAGTLFWSCLLLATSVLGFLFFSAFSVHQDELTSGAVGSKFWCGLWKKKSTTWITDWPFCILKF